MMKPFITLEGKAKQALDLYKSVFPSFDLISIQNHAEPLEELIMVATFSVEGQEVMISDSPISHEWEITPGISFFVELSSEKDLENYANSLSKNGKVMMPAGNYGFSKMFTWVEDEFGVNWQFNVN